MFKLPTLAEELSELALLVLVVMFAAAFAEGLKLCVPANALNDPIRRPPVWAVPGLVIAVPD